MRHSLFLVLLTLAGLLLAACAVGTPTPAPPPSAAAPITVAPHPEVRPSPSTTIGGGPAASPPAELASQWTVPSGQTIETALGPGWVRYESITEVFDLAFGPDGRLWATTSGGLVSWDLQDETYVLYDIKAFHLAVDPDGSLWLTIEGGLCHLDGRRCEFHPGVFGPDALGISALVVATDDTVWAGSQEGVHRFDGETWVYTGLTGGTNDLTVTASGEVWAAGGAGVARILPGQETWQLYGPEEGLPASQAAAIGVGPGGEPWTYIAWEGLYRLDGERWLPVENPPGGLVRAIEVAADGTPWIGTIGGLHGPGGNLSYWDGKAWIEVSNQAGLTSIRAIAHGPEGVVAAATQRALGLYEAGEWRLLRDGPASGRVASVAVTPDGAAWFAFGDQSVSTGGGGLSRFDGQGWDYFLDDAEVGALAVAPDGTLWAGSGCEVQRYDGGRWEVVGRCHEEVPLGNVLDIEFTSDGAAWVATGFGLARYDGLAWTAYDKAANHLMAGPDDALWVDGWEGLQGSWYLARLHGEEWTSNRLADAYPGSFRLGAVMPDGRLWGMVEGRGLASFDGGDWREASSWSFYSPQDGSPAPTSLLGASAEGTLWLTTSEGVASFVPPAGGEGNGTWTLFPAKDAQGRFYATSLAIGPDGELWFSNTRLQLPPDG